MADAVGDLDMAYARMIDQGSGQQRLSSAAISARWTAKFKHRRPVQRIDLRTSLDLISSHYAVVSSSADHKEAVQSYLEKRTPNFTGS